MVVKGKKRRYRGAGNKKKKGKKHKRGRGIKDETQTKERLVPEQSSVVKEPKGYSDLQTANGGSEEVSERFQQPQNMTMMSC